MVMYPFMVLFFLVLFLSVFIGICSSHWLMVWMAFELNMLSFIPIISSSSWFQETEGCIKYFMFQAFGSAFVLLGSVKTIFSPFLLLGLLVKLGVAPFHFWFPSVMSSCSWFTCGALMTLQKVLPMFLVIYCYDSSFSYFLLVCGVLSSVVGGVGGLNQTQLRPLLGYSSIGHMGWILIGGSCSKFISVFYFFIYFLISFCVVWLFFYSSYYSLSASSSLFNFSFFGLFLFLGLFLSLGGVPPLTGFFPKWMVISVFPSPSLLLFLLVGSLVNLYYYLNICFSIFVCRDSIYLSSVSMSFPVLLLFFCFLSIFGLPLLWYALVLFY